MEILTVRTEKRDQLVNITAQVQEIVRQQGISSGICVVFVPHTTAGVTINENADPDVVWDIIYELDKRIPWQDGYRHGEGNSAAHIKASLMGSAVTVIIEEGRLQLGTWQGIYFAEFDGPRQRKAYVKVLK